MRLTSLLLAISLGTLSTAAPAIDTVEIPHHVARDGWDWFWCTKKMIDKCIVLCRADQRHYVACRGPVCNCTPKAAVGVVERRRPRTTRLWRSRTTRPVPNFGGVLRTDESIRMQMFSAIRYCYSPLHLSLSHWRQAQHSSSETTDMLSDGRIRQWRRLPGWPVRRASLRSCCQNRCLTRFQNPNRLTALMPRLLPFSP